MSKHLYCPHEARGLAIEPLRPRGRRRANRVDDRRVIPRTMLMLETDAGWRNLLAECGPYTTICNPLTRRGQQVFGRTSSTPCPASIVQAIATTAKPERLSSSDSPADLPARVCDERNRLQ